MEFISEENKQEPCFFCNTNTLIPTRRRRKLSFHDCTFTFFRCLSCKGYSLFPALSDELIQEMYSSNYLENMYPKEGLDNKRGLDSKNESFNDQYAHLLQFLSDINLRGKTFLDFGSGAISEIYEAVTNQGGSYTGVEYDASLVLRLKGNFPNRTYYTVNELVKSDMTFDFIFCGDVAEHLSFPIKTLNVLREHLRADGKLIIQGPLEASSSLCHLSVELKSLFLKASPYEFPPYHVSLAKKESIRQMISISKFSEEYLKIYEVTWPFRSISFSIKTNLMQKMGMLLKLFDKALAFILPSYGNRFFIVVSKSKFNN